MSQRLNTTKWLCCILALSSGPLWKPVKSITAQNPPSNPTTVQAQAKFFQDFFSVQLSPYKIEFGHVCEDPHTWEQRYEKKDFKNHRDMGKVRWGDKKGGYGEHYWDLNHAGHAGNHGDDGYENDSDDGSYHVKEHPSDSYDENNDHDHSSYGNDNYDPEHSSGSYEERERSKRAHPRIKTDRKAQRETHEDEGEYDQRRLRKHSRKHSELETAPSHKVEQYSDEEDTDVEVYKKVPKKRQYKQKEEYHQPKEEKNQVVLVVKEKDDAPEQSQYDQPQQQPDLARYVNYEDGAGVRQHQQPEVAAASAPRLFLEHSTGRVVDRATGQAYILQPILNTKY